jgi:hypothetical protein
MYFHKVGTGGRQHSGGCNEGWGESESSRSMMHIYVEIIAT